MTLAYDGHETVTQFEHRVRSKVVGREILLAIDILGVDRSQVALTPDEAFRIGLGLMRDYSLARFGGG